MSPARLGPNRADFFGKSAFRKMNSGRVHLGKSCLEKTRYVFYGSVGREGSYITRINLVYKKVQMELKGYAIICWLAM